MSIHYAAKFGNIEAVRRELDSGVPVHLNDNGTPLMFAALSRRAGADMLALLLSRGADPNATAARPHNPPLFLAAQSGSPEKVRMLLEAGADARWVNPAGYSALVSAATSDTPERVEVVRLLIAAGAPLDAASRFGESPLSVSSRVAGFNMVRVLLDAGANPAPLCWTPLMRAVALGDVPELRDRLGENPDLGARDWWDRTPFLIAVHAGDVPKAKLLLEHGANIDDRARCGRPALSLAAEKDHVEMARWLLDLGVDIHGTDEFRETALMEAATHGAARCVRVLLERGADVHAKDNTKGQAVSDARTVGVLELLLDAGADVNYVDGTGYWPLKSAAEDGDVERVMFLLGRGASTEATSTGDTALHAAAKSNRLAVVRALLKAGARVNVLDVDGYTPLHEARSVEVVRALLDAGADVNLEGGMIGESALRHHRRNKLLFPLLRDAAKGRKS